MSILDWDGDGKPFWRDRDGFTRTLRDEDTVMGQPVMQPPPSLGHVRPRARPDDLETDTESAAESRGGLRGFFDRLTTGVRGAADGAVDGARDAIIADAAEDLPGNGTLYSATPGPDGELQWSIEPIGWAVVLGIAGMLVLGGNR